MENIGEYLSRIKDWVKEGWKFLFEDTNKIQAHHLLAFLLTLLIIRLLSYIIEKIFPTLMRIVLLVAMFVLVYMLIFDRTKFNQLFCHKDHSQQENPPSN